MKTYTSREVQNSFGTVFDEAKREPVTVTHYGRPSVMIVPVEFGEEAVRYYNARRLAAFLEAMPAANADAPNLTMDELNTLVHKLRP
jgi:prevent-host-death family protein